MKKQSLIPLPALSLILALVAFSIVPMAHGHFTAGHTCDYTTLGPERLVNNQFDAPGGSFSLPTSVPGWSGVGWSLGGPALSLPNAAENNPTSPGGVKASDFLSQTLSTPVFPTCLIYHAWSFTPGTTFTLTVTYTSGLPDVSSFVHPGDNSYHDVTPVFDPSRAVASIRISITAGFSNCVDNFSLTGREAPVFHAPVAKSFTLLSPTLPAGQTFVPLNTVLTWRVDYAVTNIFTTPITSVVLKDHFSAALAVDTSTITFSAPFGSGAGVPVFSTTTGEQPQWSFTWSIGILLPGQTATLSVQVHTTANPKGIQEFTQPGLQILNSGATLKWIPPSGIMQSFTTLPVFAMAGNTVGAIVGVVTSAGTALGGVTVTLFSGGTVIATASTSDVGFYHFDVVAPSTYTVSATTATGTASPTVTVTAGAITTQNLST